MKYKQFDLESLRAATWTPVDADGWITIKSALWPLLCIIPDDLMEIDPKGPNNISARGGRIRITNKGHEMLDKEKERHITILRLADRSPKDADGWSVVSARVWPLLEIVPIDLLESVRNEDGSGKARITDRGHLLLSYS